MSVFTSFVFAWFKLLPMRRRSHYYQRMCCAVRGVLVLTACSHIMSNTVDTIDHSKRQPCEESSAVKEKKLCSKKSFQSKRDCVEPVISRYLTCLLSKKGHLWVCFKSFAVLVLSPSQKSSPMSIQVVLQALSLSLFACRQTSKTILKGLEITLDINQVFLFYLSASVLHLRHFADALNRVT